MDDEKSKGKKGYVLYKSWHPLITALNDVQAGQLFKAIVEYQNGADDYTLENTVLNGIFEMMKTTFRNDAARYEETCRKRSAAGKKGGRPPGNESQKQKSKSKSISEKANETKSFSEKAKKADIEKDIDIDKGLDICRAVPALILNDGSEWRPTNNDYDGWCKVYPALDVAYEIAKMREWLISNPTKRKTKKGIRRFVTNWLGKEQDKPHPNRSGQQIRTGSRNAFNNFEQNQYDFDELEKELLNGQNNGGIANR